MNQRKAKDVIDAFEKVEKVIHEREKLPEGVLPSYMKLIDWIYQLSQKGKVKVSDLADVLGQSRPGITRACKNMEELGLITKKLNETDRRIVYVELTDKAVSYYFKYIDSYYEKLSFIFSEYDERKIDEMIEMIYQICEDMERGKENE